MEFSTFFLPLEQDANLRITDLGRNMALHTTATGFPDWEKADVVLLGCPHDGSPSPTGDIATAPMAIRKQLYALSMPVSNSRLHVADLGDLMPRPSAEGYYELLAVVVARLLEAGKFIILLGGTNDLAYGQFLGYENHTERLRYVHVDARLDLQDSAEAMNSGSFNHRIFLHRPTNLFDYANLGYQRYFVGDEERALIREMNFTAVRYGDLYEDVKEAEPYLRDAHLLSFDLSSIRHAESPGGSHAAAGGFSASDACRIARYAGMSPTLSSVSLCELSPARDYHDQTAQLAAMMAWYLIEGFYHRQPDHPSIGGAHFTKHIVQLNATVTEITFYHNAATDRWWMEVPYPDPLGTNQPETLVVACSVRDHQSARNNDIPERWWAIYNKLNG